MRRRAALYLLLGLTTALLIVMLATGMQTGGSRDPNVWIRAHQHLFLLQMLDLAALFLFVVIGLYGLTVSKLQLQLRHQAEDFGDQMQTLLHRNEELAKVNEEYADQIAALEAEQEVKPALSLGDANQKVISALHWQVDAQARQLEAVHRTLEQQHTTLEELQQHVRRLEGDDAPSLTSTPSAPQLAEAEPIVTKPTMEAPEPDPSVEKFGLAPEEPEALLTPEEYAEEETPIAVAEWTGNDSSTMVWEMLEFDVSAVAPSETEPSPAPPADAGPVSPIALRSYPVDVSLLAVAAGHLSSIPEPTAPTPEPDRIEISVSSGSTKPSSPPEPPAQAVVAEEMPPAKTPTAVAFDQAESALSSLHSETQEALSSLRAQVEAILPPETQTAPAEESESPTTRRKPWHKRF